MRAHGMSFDRIRDALPHRSVDALQGRWYRKLRRTAEPRDQYVSAPWSHRELKEVRQLKTSGLTWKQVQGHLPHRTLSSLMAAFRTSGMHGRRTLKRQPYSSKELDRLLHLKTEQRLTWVEIQRLMPSRSIHSLLRQWRNSPGRSPKKRRAFSKYEDETILRLRVSVDKSAERCRCLYIFRTPATDYSDP